MDASPGTPVVTNPATSTSWLLSFSTILAWVAPVMLAASVVLFALPVSSPGVQQCGAPGLYLLHGEADAALYTPAGKPLHGWSLAQLKQAYAHRCSHEVARRAIPAGVLFLGSILVGLIALTLTWTARRTMRAMLRGRAHPALTRSP